VASPSRDVEHASASLGSASQRVAKLAFDAVGVTDIGRQRKHNEDHMLLRPELELFVVADGMGGHNAGDIASRLATASIRNFYEATLDGTLPEGALGEGHETLSGGAQRLAAAIRKANRDVFEISSTYRQHHGMGSTVVAAALDHEALDHAQGDGTTRDDGVRTLHIGHVGDSRCYRLRSGELELLTHDHSLVNDALALKPDLTPEELARLPKNIITRALGMREDVKVDVRSVEVRAGDVYLLCSDGLSGLVDEPEIALILDGVSDLREAAEQLVSMANDNGGNDNISALLVRIRPREEGDAPEIEAAALDAAQVEAELGQAQESYSSPPCPKCGAARQGDNVFCVECGARLPSLD
jgi:protein phosphatase